jgi:CRP-like cAMP-binding protein
LLLIHPEARQPQQETELSELLVDFPCFQHVAEENFDMLIQLTREIYMECLLPDTVILNQYDEPDSCYVLMYGYCKVFVEFKTYKFGKVIKKEVKHMCDIGNSTCFGELSLLFNGKRTATVQTMEACYVLIVPK